jgi:hypothetical protein
VPRLNISVSNTENSDFCHLIADCKNCYLVFESSHVEDSYYGYWLQKSRNCIDCSYSHECEQCYEVDNCYNCYSLFYSQNSQNCSDSAFLDNCIACKDCLFSTNLRQKQYCIMNEQYTKEEYEAKKAELLFGSYNATANMKQLFADFMLKQPHRAQRSTNAENSTGDYIINSKDCHECFHAHEAEGCRYGEHTWRHSKDNMDVDTVGREAELVYQALNTGIGGYQCAFTNQCWTNVANIYYSQHCFSSKDLFGCVGLTNKQYCIFNKQYSKEQYEQLVADIIKHMQQTRLPDGQAGEWGQYFPASLSTFGYNESSAFEEFPLTKDEAIAKGYNWHDDTESSDYMGPKVELPDNIEDADESICQQILTCAVTGKPYKIIPHEFAFYKQMGLSLPRLHPNERHTQRMARRTPCKLWNRECHKCSTAISTSYSPDRPEIIYCEDCYLSTVY